MEIESDIVEYLMMSRLSLEKLLMLWINFYCVVVADEDDECEEVAIVVADIDDDDEDLKVT